MLQPFRERRVRKVKEQSGKVFVRAQRTTFISLIKSVLCEVRRFTG